MRGLVFLWIIRQKQPDEIVTCTGLAFSDDVLMTETL